MLTTSFIFAPLPMRISVEILSEFIIEICNGVMPKIIHSNVEIYSNNSFYNMESISTHDRHAISYHNHWVHLSRLCVLYSPPRVEDRRMPLMQQLHEDQYFLCCPEGQGQHQMLTRVQWFQESCHEWPSATASVKRDDHKYWI